MPKLTRSLPKYRKHKATGQAIVTIGCRDFYLGPHGTKASKTEYDRLISEWLAEGRLRLAASSSDALSVTELCAAFWRYAKAYYVKNGKQTGTADNFKPAIRLLKQIYGHTRANDFSPTALKMLRSKMIL